MASTERPLVADEHDKPETTTSLTQHGSTENDQAKPEPGYQSGLPFFLVVFALLLSMFLIALDMTIIATAIPSITDDFHSAPDVGWYAAAFFITLAIFQSAWGKAYKHFNIKITFVVAVVLFEVGSLICGVSQNSLTFIVGRAIAGLGGAGVTGGVYTAMAYIVQPAQVPTYIGLIGAVFSVASVAGPPLGGALTGEVSWRWVFYINLPIGGFALLIIFIYFHLPATVKPVPIGRKELIFVMDIPGIVLGMGALVSFTLAMQWGGTLKPWSSPDVIGTLVGSVIMTVLFAVLQWRAGENASLVTRIMTQRTVAALSAFIFFLNSTNFLLVYNLPQYFQVINDLSATESGIRNLALILSTSAFVLASGFILGRVGYYHIFLISGSALLTVGAGLVYTLDLDSTVAEVVGFQILVGMGIGLAIQAPVIVAQAFSAPEDIPVVTSIVMFFQLVAGAICVSASQTLLNNRLISALADLAPNISSEQVFAVGATEIRDAFQGADLVAVLKSYMVGLKDSWLFATVLAAITFLLAFSGEWKSVKGAKPAAVA